MWGLLLLPLIGGLVLKDPNEPTYQFVTNEILKNEKYYITNIPKDIPHSFNVSFLFPHLKWNEDYGDTDSDEFYCFTDKIKRRLKKLYAGNDEYKSSYPYEIRNFYNETYIIADFGMNFVKSIPWPAWNKTRVTSVFPLQFQGLVEVYPYPHINESYNPVVNYTKNQLEWFDVIKDVNDFLGKVETSAYYGFYDIAPPPPSYKGPAIWSIPNLAFYALLSLSVFILLLTLFFWAINGTRESLLLAYWMKGRDDMQRSDAALKPGDM